MAYQAIDMDRLPAGQPVPVDLRAPDGRLLLRRGQILLSESHRALLQSHQPCMTEADALAWQRAIERALRTQRMGNGNAPVHIDPSDYADAPSVQGGWADLHEMLQGMLYMGTQAQQPLRRLEGIERQVERLVQADPDQALFELFQALPQLTHGYCATHALLTAVLSTLTLDKLADPAGDAVLLRRAALVMNIGMARPQDALALQRTPPNPLQRAIIKAHPTASAEVLADLQASDDALLQLVRWHAEPGLAKLRPVLQSHLQTLALAESVTARLAPRVSRPAQSPLLAAKALLAEGDPDTQALRSAMVAVLGFYPPGTYVTLSNGEVAVVMQRGERAHTPHVASIIDAKGMPLSRYLHHDTKRGEVTIRQTVDARSIRLKLDAARVLRLRQQSGLAL